VERSSLARINDRAGVIKVSRHKVVAATELTPYQREYLVEEWHNDGTVTVKLPSAAKLRENALPEEIAAYDELRAAQRDRRQSPAAPESVEQGQPAVLRCRKKAPLPLVMWQGYSEEHLRRQYEFMPLPAEFSTFDLDTGEVYPADQVWQRGAEYLRNNCHGKEKTQGRDTDTASHDVHL
jgi:hypothetical protein